MHITRTPYLGPLQIIAQFSYYIILKDLASVLIVHVHVFVYIDQLVVNY